MTQPSEIKALNPTCQLPVLLINGVPMADSTTIARWIETRVPGSLAPSSGSSEFWLWEEFADTALNNLVVASRWADNANFARLSEAFFGNAPLPIRMLIPRQLRKRILGDLSGRDVGRHGWPVFWKRAQSLLDEFDARAPETGFWLGENASIVDAAIFGQLQSLRTPLTPEQRAWLEARRRLTSYLDRFEARTKESADPARVAA
jgi:glutathione S-transferase